MTRGPSFNPILGDVITQANGRPIQTASDLYSVLDKLTPGDTITLTILRRGNLLQVTLKTD
jgi:S1-C subfamily serine protease